MRMQRLHRCFFLLVISTAGLVTPLFSQAANNSPGDQELLKARKANEEAQAEYYREQTKKLQLPTPSPTPLPKKTFWDNLSENPASAIGIVGTITAALTAALVGLLTLFFNSRNTTRAQQDTQFYAALERFGDTESPSMRSSAAGLLAQMARTESTDISVKKEPPFFQVERRQPYLRTALDQLLTGFRLEANNIALGAISAALAGFIPDHPKELARKLYIANFDIQEELLSLMAKLFVMNGVEFSQAFTTGPNVSSVWTHAESTTPYSQYVLKDFANARRDDFKKLFTRYRPALTAKTEPASLLFLQDEFRVLCQRLERNVLLLCEALKASHWEPRDEKSFRVSFLVGGNLANADLSHLNFSLSQMTRVDLTAARMTSTNLGRSYLKDAEMSSASLNKASLFGAHLEGANLENSDVTDAAMGRATINEFTRLEGCNWWAADLREESWKEEPATDFDLAAKLFERSGDSIPMHLTGVHFSVRDVLPKLTVLPAVDGD